MGVSAASGGPNLASGVLGVLASNSAPASNETELVGTVTDVDCAAGALTIDGVTVLMTEETEWDDGFTCEEITPGTLIKVHALDQDGMLVAREVEPEDEHHADEPDEGDENEDVCEDLADSAAAEGCQDAVSGAAGVCVGIANEADLDRCEDAIDAADEACDDLEDEAAEDACENELDLLEDAAEDALDALEEDCDLLEGQEQEDCEDALDGDDEDDSDNSGPGNAHDADEGDSDNSGPGNADDADEGDEDDDSDDDEHEEDDD